MRILHVITTLDVGGAEMHVLAQVRGQVKAGHAVRVVWLKGEGRVQSEMIQAGAERAERAGRGIGLVTGLWSHVRWAELVHTHLLKADMLGAVLALCAGRARVLVASKHNDEQVLKRPLVSFVHGIVGRIPRRTIVLSDHVAGFIEKYGRIPRDRLVRIYYGLDPKPFELAASARPVDKLAARTELGFEARDVVFVCVARFAAQKAHDVLLRAFASARAEPGGELLRLLLVGDDPFGDGRVRAEQLARELNLGPACVFAGIRRDVPRLMAASDVFVMCSLWEGLGLVFLEAMATGLPVLATRVSAIPEVVVEGETGLLVPPRDERRLAEAMCALARDPSLRARLGAAGSKRVHVQFALERMVAETLAVYGTMRGIT